MKDAVDSEKLMKLVEERPELWDKSLYTYKDKYITRAAWREICAALTPNFDRLEEDEQNAFDKLLVAKWNHLRDNWVRHYKKMRYCEKNGDLKTRKKYIYFDQMSFLRKIYDDNETTSGMESPSSSTAAECSSSKIKARNSIPSSPTEPPEKRHKSNDLEQKLLQILENPNVTSESANPHMAFFTSLLPSLSGMTEDQILEFRMDVLLSIKRIKQPIVTTMPSVKLENEDFL